MENNLTFGDIGVLHNSPNCIIVGKNKLRDLLQPKHKYYEDKQGWLKGSHMGDNGNLVHEDAFAIYFHGKDCNGEDIKLYYPRVRSLSKKNPYKLSQQRSIGTSKVIRKLKALKKKEEIKVLRAIVIIPTCPEEVSEWLSKQPNGVKLAWDIDNAFWEGFEKLEENSGLSAMTNLHPWSTENPLEPHDHFHSFVLALRMVNGKLIPKRFHKWKDEDGYHFGPFSPEMLEEIDKLWHKCICDFAWENNIEGDWSRRITYDPVTKRFEQTEGDTKTNVFIEWVEWSDYTQEDFDKDLESRRKLVKEHPDWKWAIRSLACLEGMNEEEVEAYIYKRNSRGRARFMHKINYQARHPLEDYAKYSNKHLDCPNPPEWLEKYNNKSRGFGWWKELGKLTKDVELEKEGKLSPIDGEPMEWQGSILGRCTVDGLLLQSNGKIGSLEFIKGEPVLEELTQEDIEWLKSMEYCRSP